jgi:hypothetical protein
VQAAPGFGAGGAFAPSSVSATDFGMPEILPPQSMSPTDILLDGMMGPSGRDFASGLAGGCRW